MNTITKEEFQKLTVPVKLIDVREVSEYKMGYVEGSLNVPLGALLNNPEMYLTKDEKTYIICNSGGRSAMACDMLSEKGYTHLVDVLGGVLAFNGELVK